MWLENVVQFICGLYASSSGEFDTIVLSTFIHCRYLDVKVYCYYELALFLTKQDQSLPSIKCWIKNKSEHLVKIYFYQNIQH